MQPASLPSCMARRSSAAVAASRPAPAPMVAVGLNSSPAPSAAEAAGVKVAARGLLKEDARRRGVLPALGVSASGARGTAGRGGVGRGAHYSRGGLVLVSPGGGAQLQVGGDLPCCWERRCW
jgi:hypothetical protein